MLSIAKPNIRDPLEWVNRPSLKKLGRLASRCWHCNCNPQNDLFCSSCCYCLSPTRFIIPSSGLPLSFTLFNIIFTNIHCTPSTYENQTLTNSSLFLSFFVFFQPIFSLFFFFNNYVRLPSVSDCHLCPTVGASADAPDAPPPTPLLGRGRNAQQPVFQKISRHPKFRVTDPLASYLGTPS